jgi:hypothetical protein
VFAIPCTTLSWNVEQPVTLCEYGDTSVLARNNIELIRKEFINALDKHQKRVHREPWTGFTVY